MKDLKNSVNIIDLGLISLAFLTNPILGILMLIYIWDRYKKYQELSNWLLEEINAKSGREEEESDKEQLILQKIKAKIGHKTPKKVEPYRGYLIEDHDLYFEILSPEGELLDKLFPSMEGAMRGIDEMPMVEPKYERSRVQNIRFVR